MEVRFIFKTSAGKPQVHSRRLPVVVGRSDGDDVQLRIPKDSISRRHCEFLLDDAGRVCVQDLESTNGTFLEGRRLGPRAASPVESGSTVKLGNVAFRLEYSAAAPRPATRDSETIAIDADEVPAPAAPLPPDMPTAAVALPTEPAEPAPTSDAGDFGFLEAVPPAAAADEPAWPEAAEPPAVDDKGLEDFFKGLS